MKVTDMRASSILAVSLSLICFGCADGTSVLSLNITSPDVISNVDHVTVVVTDVARQKKSSPAQFPISAGSIPPTQTIALVLPSKIRGSVHVDVIAATADGTTQGLGSGDYTVSPSKQSSGDLVVRSIDALPDPNMSTVVVDRPTGVMANGADAAVVTVTLLNSHGTPLPGVTVQLSATGSNVNFSTIDPTQPDGTTKSSVTSTVAQTSTITATALGITIAQQPTVEFVAARPAHLAFVMQPANGYAQRPMPAFQVAVQDDQGQTITTATNTITLALSTNTANAAVMGISSVDAVAGVATFDVLGVTVPAQGLTLTATAQGLGMATSNPFNVATYPWQLVNSPTLYGGNLGTMVIAPAMGSAPMAIYTQSAGGLFVSTDVGATWSAATFGLASGGRLTVDPSSGAVYLASNAAGAKFIMKTTNRGGAWEGYGAGTTGQYAANSIAVDPSNPAIVYAGNDVTVFKSTDGGKHWSATPFGMQVSNGGGLAVDQTTSSTVYAVGRTATGSPLFRSIDAGATWAQVTNGLPAMETVLRLYAFKTGVFLTDTAAHWYRSTDGGASFSMVTATPSSNGTVLAASPSDVMTLYLTDGTAVWLSTDGGATFANPRNLTKFRIRDLAVHPTNPSQLFAATDHGVFISTDAGMTWTQSNVGIAQLTINSMDADKYNSGRLVLGTNDGRTFYTSDGNTWMASTMDPTDTNQNIAAVAAGPDRLFLCTGPDFHVSLDGAMWGTTTMTQCGPAIAAVANVIFAGGGSGVFKSTDLGSTWSTSPVFNMPTWSLAESTNGSIVLAGLNAGGVYRSTDTGANWTSVQTGDLVNGFAYDSTYDANRIVAAVDCTTSTGDTGGFRASNDAGATWGMLQNAGTCVKGIYELKNWFRLYAVANAKNVPTFFSSSDKGMTWQSIPLGTYAPVNRGTVAAGPSNKVFVGTTAGVYESTTFGL